MCRHVLCRAGQRSFWAADHSMPGARRLRTLPTLVPIPIALRAGGDTVSCWRTTGKLDHLFFFWNTQKSHQILTELKKHHEEINHCNKQMPQNLNCPTAAVGFCGTETLDYGLQEIGIRAFQPPLSKVLFSLLPKRMQVIVRKKIRDNFESTSFL